MAKLAFLGPGQMGTPMVTRLLNTGQLRYRILALVAFLALGGVIILAISVALGPTSGAG